MQLKSKDRAQQSSDTNKYVKIFGVELTEVASSTLSNTSQIAHPYHQLQLHRHLHQRWTLQPMRDPIHKALRHTVNTAGPWQGNQRFNSGMSTITVDERANHLLLLRTSPGVVLAFCRVCSDYSPTYVVDCCRSHAWSVPSLALFQVPALWLVFRIGWSYVSKALFIWGQDWTLAYHIVNISLSVIWISNLWVFFSMGVFWGWWVGPSDMWVVLFLFCIFVLMFPYMHKKWYFDSLLSLSLLEKFICGIIGICEYTELICNLSVFLDKVDDDLVLIEAYIHISRYNYRFIFFPFKLKSTKIRILNLYLNSNYWINLS